MISLTMDEAKEVYRFLQTLDSCEYRGVAPKFDDITAEELGTIAHSIWLYIQIEEMEKA